ncbi:MAG: hypothetical protein ACI8P9_002230 [Parasphingorhabdus sp.]|jgi:hypothetical protein
MAIQKLTALKIKSLTAGKHEHFFSIPPVSYTDSNPHQRVFKSRVGRNQQKREVLDNPSYQTEDKN